MQMRGVVDSSVRVIETSNPFSGTLIDETNDSLKAIVYEFYKVPRDLDQFLQHLNPSELDVEQYKHIFLERDLGFSFRPDITRRNRNNKFQQDSFTRTLQARVENIRSYIDPKNNSTSVSLPVDFIFNQIGLGDSRMDGSTAISSISKNDLLQQALDVAGYSFLIINDFQNDRLDDSVDKLILVELSRDSFPEDIIEGINWRIPLSYALIGFSSNNAIDSAFLFGVWTSAYGRLRYDIHDRYVHNATYGPIRGITVQSNFPKGLGRYTIGLSISQVKFKYFTDPQFLILDALYPTRKTFMVNDRKFYVPIYQLFPDQLQLYQHELYEPAPRSIPPKTSILPSEISRNLAWGVHDYHFIYIYHLGLGTPKKTVTIQCKVCDRLATHKCVECNVTYCGNRCFIIHHPTTATRDKV